MNLCPYCGGDHPEETDVWAGFPVVICPAVPLGVVVLESPPSPEALDLRHAGHSPLLTDAEIREAEERLGRRL